MPRIFLPSDINLGETVVITREKAHYLATVLRSKEGDHVCITGSRGHSYLAKVIEITKKEVKVEILEQLNFDSESGLDISLVQGLLKGDKMDLVIQKATELGVKKIIPVRTERSQTRETRKLSRWKKIAEEASKQSGRHIVPEVIEPADFNTLFREGHDAGSGIIFWEESSAALTAVLGKKQAAGRIMLITGPEGGFSSKEVETAANSGMDVASLGRRILRAETAAITAVSIVQYVLGDLGV